MTGTMVLVSVINVLTVSENNPQRRTTPEMGVRCFQVGRPHWQLLSNMKPYTDDRKGDPRGNKCDDPDYSPPPYDVRQCKTQQSQRDN